MTNFHPTTTTILHLTVNYCERSKANFERLLATALKTEKINAPKYQSQNINKIVPSVLPSASCLTLKLLRTIKSEFRTSFSRGIDNRKDQRSKIPVTKYKQNSAVCVAERVLLNIKISRQKRRCRSRPPRQSDVRDEKKRLLLKLSIISHSFTSCPPRFLAMFPILLPPMAFFFLFSTPKNCVRVLMQCCFAVQWVIVSDVGKNFGLRACFNLPSPFLAHSSARVSLCSLILLEEFVVRAVPRRFVF